MPYFLLAGPIGSEEITFETYLSSGFSLAAYWIWPAEKLKLETLLELLGEAETEKPYTVSGAQLERLHEEIGRLAAYWRDEEDPKLVADEDRLANMQRILNFLRSTDLASVEVQIA